MQDFAERLLQELRAQFPSLEDVPTPNVKAALNRAINKMDLVTREEFDAQAAVLARTRQKLEALEKQVEAMEQSQG
ncbi:accessory factor UbiK family protein [Gilvimarinus sp. SDUM040013]|uniref:Ubiquinone biosynthesis accessory factor UbiK n=1 Tax=Gilvimarinus gilvus TaxID=3058038 RepID=A0ABU4S383_9GAMM|nr:accessory factor UbiK family protein [Gilvimarinus sp. SDUM040013]MDO3385822.1 accessory factor UbiK family protein [Gilvimarinus sp. SDUM040013]MDX6851389.1 accessory factor UbiK family protein [Gilvimarinus sp. SDUM040013]